MGFLVSAAMTRTILAMDEVVAVFHSVPSGGLRDG